MAYFSVPLLLVLFVLVSGETPTLDDLKMALNTTEKFWMLGRSYKLETSGKEHLCVYAAKNSLKDLEYDFNQTYKVDQQWVTLHLYGTLGEGSEELPVLQVRQEKELRTGKPYTLVNWNREKHCGILKVDVNGKNQYELYAWDSSVKGSRDACKSEFQQICKECILYEVYSNVCV
uniref:Uncharacterized protein n=1 Tax=Amblyomma americanum TaxID=6943 RepID=A0A0C9S4T6_AMBAM